jgi:hypothetical protein
MANREDVGGKIAPPLRVEREITNEPAKSACIFKSG